MTSHENVQGEGDHEDSLLGHQKESSPLHRRAELPDENLAEHGNRTNDHNRLSGPEESHSRHKQRRTWRQRLKGTVSVEKLSNELKSQLQVASESLLDLLFEHLSKTADSGSSSDPKGLSLPASAVGWLSVQLFQPDVSPTIGEEATDDLFTWSSSETSFALTPSVKDRLPLLRYLMPRATHVRVTADEWPLPSKSRRKRRKRKRNLQQVREQYERDYGTDSDDEPEDANNTQPRLTRFLKFYDALTNRPRVDMRVFPNCQVLLLDQVPTEWIWNLYAIRDSLQVVRVERSCIYDLTAFLLPVEQKEESFEEAGADISLSTDPLAATTDDPSTNSKLVYSKLTHVKLSHCSLTDYSGLKGRSATHSMGPKRVPPLAHLVNLQSLCLSHNQLSSESAALQGLSRMPFLTKVDLSFNRITSLRRANYRLGNIQTLLLSHNKLESAEGIDRLYSLETLWLDHNIIDNLSKVSALARLPELRSLRLDGNPLEIERPRAYRIEVLDLFRERRIGSLPRNATYRHLQEALPILDQHKASMTEMLALKERTFMPSLQQVPANNTSLEEETVAIDVSFEAGISERRLARSSVLPSRPIRPEPTKRNQALVNRSIQHVAITPLGSLHPSERLGPAVEFSLGDVLRSLCNASVLEKGSESPSEGESMSECLETPSSTAKDVPVQVADSEEEHSFEVEPDTEVNREFKEEREEPLAETQQSTINDSLPEKEIVNGLTTKAHGDIEHEKAFEDLKLSPIKSDEADETDESREVTSKTAVANEGMVLEKLPENGAQVVFPPNAKLPVPLPPPRRNISDLSDSAHGNLSRLPLSFPDLVSSDDHSSVQSPLNGSPRRGESFKSKEFQLAEENAVYDGPDTMKSLKIQEDLELYFRLFVFPVSQLEDDVLSRSTATETNDENEWRSILKRFPRIQLWPIDRILRDTDPNACRPEEFRRVWKERVVACGKPAVRRLTPNRRARFGFHGELLWSDSSASHLKPETVVECREVILCCSNSCLYFILDYDKVTYKAKDQKRKFPLPIPPEAHFKDAIWPHALARHPFSSLRAITIGFGFQRLTLRFGISTTASPDDFTYILLTSNKTQTVSLLKEFQDLANEATTPANPFAVSECPLVIENDDRHVLDALGVALAPDVIGDILHYQILEQRWRRGERGNVRRVCVLTDTKLYLLDEDYVGDGSKSFEAATQQLGETVYRVVDSAALSQVTQVLAADADPNATTIVIKPLSSFQRSHNWRLLCRDRLGAERLVEDVRRAMTLVSA